MYTRIYSFFDFNKLLSSNQFGFVKGKGIEQAALTLLSDLYNSESNKLNTSAAFLDYSKAFDTVDHDILLQKLEKYGIRGQSLELLKSYFQDRKQYVSLNNTVSQYNIIRTGVPQGSCLGPLFFIIYINDIVASLKNLENIKIILFADDIVIYISSPSIELNCNILNEYLDIIYRWSCANKLILNPHKSKVIHFFNSAQLSTHPSIMINSDIIEEVNNIKYLGLTIQSNLKFNIHIKNVVSNISRCTGILYALKPYFPSDCLRKLYYAFLYPHLTLHILAWGSSRPNVLESVLVAQNRAVRNLKVSSSASETYNKLNLLRFNNIYKLFLAAFMYNQTKSNGIFSDLVNNFQWSHSHNTRRTQQFRIPLTNTISSEGFWLSKGISHWNSIPNDFKDLASISIFKKRYREHLLSIQRLD